MHQLNITPVVARLLRVEVREAVRGLPLVLCDVDIHRVAEVALEINYCPGILGLHGRRERPFVRKSLRGRRLGKIGDGIPVLGSVLIESGKVKLAFLREVHRVLVEVRVVMAADVKDLVAHMVLAALSGGEILDLLAVRGELPDVITVPDQQGFVLADPTRV